MPRIAPRAKPPAEPIPAPAVRKDVAVPTFSAGNQVPTTLGPATWQIPTLRDARNVSTMTGTYAVTNARAKNRTTPMARKIIMLLRTLLVSSMRPNRIPANTPTTDVTEDSVVSSAWPTPNTFIVSTAQAGKMIRL